MSSSRRKKAETPAGSSAAPSPASPGGSGSKGRTRRAVATPPPERTGKEKEEEAATPPLVEEQSRASTPPTVGECVARALSFDGELQVVVSQRERRLRSARMRLEALLDKYDADVKSGSFITDREKECAKQLREIDDDLRLALQPTLYLPTEEQSSGIYVLGTVGQLRFLDLLPGDERRGLFGTAYKGKVGASGLILYSTAPVLRLYVAYEADEDGLEVLPSEANETLFRACSEAYSPPLEERFDKYRYFEFAPDVLQKGCALRFQGASSDNVLLLAAVMVRDRAPSGRQTVAPHAASPKGNAPYVFAERSAEVQDEDAPEQEPNSCTVQ